MNFYRWLYKRLGGRPWTYIIRDFYHEAEYFIILGMLALGFFLPRWISLGDFVKVLAGITGGYILGHLFWGTRYVPGQRNQGNRHNPRRDSMRKGE